MPMGTTIQYLTRKANEIFERSMRHAAQKICERQSLFHGRAA
jgi:hypothetical protein